MPVKVLLFIKTKFVCQLSFKHFNLLLSMVRFKQRYLLAQVLVEKGAAVPSTRDLYSAITGRVSALLGVWGFGVCKVTLSLC